MIVVDTSALYAIYAQENETERFLDVIAHSGRALIGAPTAFEYRLVVYRRHGAGGLAAADPVLALPPLEIVPFTPDMVDIAVDALARFGGRPASLNYGDCMSYALAKSLGSPLLYKGGDFARTDVRAAI